jgi:hypothetical protein
MSRGGNSGLSDASVSTDGSMAGRGGDAGVDMGAVVMTGAKADASPVSNDAKPFDSGGSDTISAPRLKPGCFAPDFVYLWGNVETKTARYDNAIVVHGESLVVGVMTDLPDLTIVNIYTPETGRRNLVVQRITIIREVFSSEAEGVRNLPWGTRTPRIYENAIVNSTFMNNVIFGARSVGAEACF